MFEEAARCLFGLRNVYLDTALCASFLSADELLQAVRAHGSDRVLFGSDSPWSRAEQEQAFIEQSGLLPAERARIYYENAFALFGYNADGSHPTLPTRLNTDLA